MDLKVIGKKVLKVFIPLFLIAAITISLFLIASEGETVKYANITSKDYDLGSGDYNTLDNVPDCVYSGFLPVAQKGNLTMYFNSSTTNVAIYDSATGRTVTSMIPEEELNKAKSQNSDTTSSMRSNFVLTAVNMEDGSTVDLNMFDSMGENGQRKVEGIKDGIRITYIIGEIPETYLIPQALSEKRFNQIKKQLSEDDVYTFENRYMAIDISLYYGEEKAEFLAKYPSCKKETVYVINEEREFILREVEEVFATIDYTEEQKLKDEKEVMAEVEEEAYTVFRIPMEFKLNDDNFSVTVDRDGIKYSDAALPIAIDVCPYLMRAYSDENGYMLLPDGSGSLLNLNNGKTQLDSYYTRIYGEDPLYYPNFSRVEDSKAQLPVYGIKSQKGGMFAYVSEQAEEAYIKANISGKVSQVNNVVSRFQLFGFVKEMVLQDWAATGSGTIYNNRIHGDAISGKCTTNYYILPADKCEYTDMAVLCREILIKDGKLKAKNDVNDNTALVNLLGVYDYKKSVMGVPVNANKVMTTAKQATEIINSLKEKGINLDARYLAAVNGGFRQTMANGMSLASGVGSKKEIKNLNSAVKNAGGKLYMDLAFTKVYKNKSFDGFSVSNDSVAKINTKHTTFFARDTLSFYYVKSPYYYLAPANFKDNMNDVLKDVKKLGISGIAFRNMGETLYSDADDDNFTIRAEIADEFTKATDAAAKENISLMYNGGGAYVYSNASYLAGIPFDSANYAITDESVPFLQMVIHGSIPYTYKPVLDAADVKKHMLDSVATGAKLQFNVSGKNSFELKNTDYSAFFNTAWEDNSKDIEEYCKFVEDAVKATSGKKFISYERINENVTKSVFSDGVTVYVNYSDKDYSVGEIMIKAQNYTLVK